MFPDPWHRNQEENLSESMTVILVGPRRKYPQSIATENQISRERRASQLLCPKATLFTSSAAGFPLRANSAASRAGSVLVYGQLQVALFRDLRSFKSMSL
uniref:Uncharacterized protein n=1 Tax=Rhodosorus marinus TaxID=101924 RepID=A0A7S3ELL1_9RHOD